MVIGNGRLRGPVVVFAIAVIWTVTLSGTAVAAPCSPPRSAAKLTLQLQLGSPQYVYGLDTAGIREVISENQGYVAGPWHLPLGLTTAELGMGYETKFYIRKSQSPGYCVALAEANVTVGYTGLTIYISNSYAEGTCEFDAILTHEQEHLQINRDVLEVFKAKYREVLRRMGRGKRVIFVHRKGEARSAYVLYLRRQFKPLVAEMQAVLARRNGAIDTKENYQRVLAQCDNWFAGDLEAAGPKPESGQTGSDSGFKIIHAPPANPE